MTDGRKTLKARLPNTVKRKCIIQVVLSAELYQKLYFMAYDHENSLADEIRALIAKYPVDGP